MIQKHPNMIQKHNPKQKYIYKHQIHFDKVKGTHILYSILKLDFQLSY